MKYKQCQILIYKKYSLLLKYKNLDAELEQLFKITVECRWNIQLITHIGPSRRLRTRSGWNPRQTCAEAASGIQPFNNDVSTFVGWRFKSNFTLNQNETKQWKHRSKSIGNKFWYMFIETCIKHWQDLLNCNFQKCSTKFE